MTEHLRPVLRAAWEQPFTTKSDTARAHADALMQALELGLLTVRRADGAWTNSVRITAAGLVHLNPLNYTLPPEEEPPIEDGILYRPYCPPNSTLLTNEYRL